MNTISKDPKLLSVLVVDDAPDAAATTAKMLELSGFETRIARDGEEALRSMADDPPDAVLLDIGMPGMDGWEVAKTVAERAGPKDRQPLLVAVTGYGSEEDRKNSKLAGMDLHLVKPVDPEVLVKVLRRFERVIDGIGPN